MKNPQAFLITILLIIILSMGLVSAGLCKDSRGYYKDCNYDKKSRYKDYKFDPFNSHKKYYEPYDLKDRASIPIFKGSYGNYRYEMYTNGDYRPYSYYGGGYTNYGFFGGGFGYRGYYGGYYSRPFFWF